MRRIIHVKPQRVSAERLDEILDEFPWAEEYAYEDHGEFYLDLRGLRMELRELDDPEEGYEDYNNEED